MSRAWADNSNDVSHFSISDYSVIETDKDRWRQIESERETRA